MSFDVRKNLKSKAFFISCPGHDGKNGKIFSNKQAHENLQRMGVELAKGNDFLTIQKEIAEENYHGYASMLFFLELECFDFKIKQFQDFVYHAIRRNSTLKYVTKLVISYSFVEMKFGKTHWTVLSTDHRKKLNFKYPSLEKIREIFPDLKQISYDLLEDMPGAIVIKVLTVPEYRKKYIDLLRQYTRTKVPFIDNLILLEFVQLGLPKTQTILEQFYSNLLALAEQTSLQEIAQNTIGCCVDTEVYQELASFATSCNGGCYVYNVNPALAIVFNHQSFPAHLNLNFRAGSLKDMEALQRTLLAKKITPLTLSDGSLEQVQATMRKVSLAKFKGIKNFFIFIMSHGDEGDIIYTRTNSYSVRDEILKPLLANPTLREVQKFVIVNACRGRVDPREDDEDIVEEIRCSEEVRKSGYPNDEKLMVIYSTQKGFISQLFNNGAIFVQTFCNIFLENFDEKTMESIGEEIKTKMKNCILDDQIPDFGTANELTHNIRMEFVNFYNNNEILEEMAEFFKNYLQQNLDLNTIDENVIRADHDRSLLGIGFVDGPASHRLTDTEKKTLEQYIEAKQTKLGNNAKILSDFQVSYEWHTEFETGRSRVCMRGKRLCELTSKTPSPKKKK